MHQGLIYNTTRTDQQYLRIDLYYSGSNNLKYFEDRIVIFWGPNFKLIIILWSLDRFKKNIYIFGFSLKLSVFQN